MMLSLALIANAQPVPQGQRPNPTVGGAKPVGEAASRETVIQKCSRIEADAVYLIPETNYFHGRIEASGFDVFAQRVRVPRREKAGIVARALPVRWGWAGA